MALLASSLNWAYVVTRPDTRAASRSDLRLREEISTMPRVSYHQAATSSICHATIPRIHKLGVSQG